jgi:PKD repeat protein
MKAITRFIYCATKKIGMTFCVAFCISICAFSQLPVACITPGIQHICPGTCTDYLNCSTNATSYQWIFAGANPSISTDVNPTGICYNAPGIYHVTLIASNSLGSDTILFLNYLTVYPLPPPIAIEYCGDTLFATQGFLSYQWYLNGNTINGATDYFYIASQSANYNVVATDVNGCEVEAVIYPGGWGGSCNCCTGIEEFANGNKMYVYPNPVCDKLIIGNLKLGTSTKGSICNTLGENVIEIIELSYGKEGGEVNVSKLADGIYFINIEIDGHIERLKFIKQ